MKRIIMTAARGGIAESSHGIEFRTMSLFQVEMRYASTFQQIFFVMSTFEGHHRFVGLLELLNESFHILSQLDSWTRFFLEVGILG